MPRGFLVAFCFGALFVAVSYASVVDITPPGTRPAFCGSRQCPNFTLVLRTADYEIRRYEPTTWVSTSRESSWFGRWTMFRRLAKYTLRGYNSEGLEMNMTVPVLTRVSDTEPDAMYFMLPEDQQINPPSPIDPLVSIVRMPAQIVFVRSFGGFANSRKYMNEARILKTVLYPSRRNYQQGVMYKVGYNKPWARKNRHNEVWLIGV